MFVLMGANGHIASKAARLLISRGKKVRVIGRHAARLKPLTDAGAEPAIGDATDVKFLAGAFVEAQGVFTMIPPNYAAPDMRAFQSRVGAATAEALAAARVSRVINLSSVGAGLAAGTGPIAGLHEQEERLNRLPGLDLLHLRPAYFFENHLAAVPAVKAMGVFPGMIKADVPFAQIDTRDIASVLADEFARPGRYENRIRHLLGPRDLAMNEVARILGAAAGRPALAYAQVPGAAAKKSMVDGGFSPNVADSFEEMCEALSDGRITRTVTRDAESTTPTAMKEFAPEFAATLQA
jgi:uncharacterized protein YbjT (DUF2867 family)